MSMLALSYEVFTIPTICVVLVVIGIIHWLVTKNTWLLRICSIVAICILLFVYLVPKMIGYFHG